MGAIQRLLSAQVVATHGSLIRGMRQLCDTVSRHYKEPASSDMRHAERSPDGFHRDGAEACDGLVAADG